MRTASAVLFLSVCSAILTISSRGGVANAAAGAPAVAQYHCPMHPSYVQDERGDCPACGMKLVPVKGAANPVARVPAARALAIAADKQKVLGIVVTPALRSGAARTVRALGRVVPDEARIYRINAGAPGSIRDVSPVVTGSRVKRDQVLGSFYAPDTISGTQLFVLNTQGFARKKVQTVTEEPRGEKGEDDADVGKNNSSLYKANVQQRVIQLENFGISAIQREQIMREGRVPDAVWIVAPADGVVLARNISLGQKFDRGFEFSRIADLRKVWVLADVFPQDARNVRAGMRAEISLPEQRIALAATATEILPQFDAATRTLKVKLTVDNPGFVLRPDMFVDVALKAELPAGVLVAADAIVDSGLVKRVFVQTAEGVFEPRVVETGWRSGDQVEVVKGLRPGELVVSSGTFFLDSETRMRPPPSGAAAASELPVPTWQRSRGGAGDAIEAREIVAREEGRHGRAGSAR